MTETFVFVDCEASSLGDDSYPIEIGWCTEDGSSMSYLIRPEDDWLDWDPKAEAVHGISREKLVAEGVPAVEVARLVSAALTGMVVSDAPNVDEYWLRRLNSAAGLQPTGVEHVYTAYRAAVRPLTSRLPRSLTESIARSFLQRAEDEALVAEPERHRAESDARRLWRTWTGLKLLVDGALDGWPWRGS